MNVSFFIFNEFNSEDHLIITQPVVRPSWARKVSEVAAGSVSKIIQLSRTYENSPLEMSTVITDTSCIKDIYSKLRGYGKLVLSSAPEEYINAVAEILQPIGVAQDMAELDVNFTLMPFAYAVQPTKVSFGESPTKVNNPGTVFSAPEIKFTPTAAGEAAIWVNGASFVVRIPDNLAGKEVVIDCDAEVTYYTDDSGSKVSINQLTYNDYPLLHEGTNYINYTGSVSSAEINVRERWY